MDGRNTFLEWFFLPVNKILPAHLINSETIGNCWWISILQFLSNFSFRERKGNYWEFFFFFNKIRVVQDFCFPARGWNRGFPTSRVSTEISVQTICMEYVIPRSADAIQSGQKCQISNHQLISSPYYGCRKNIFPSDCCASDFFAFSCIMRNFLKKLEIFSPSATFTPLFSSIFIEIRWIIWARIWNFLEYNKYRDKYFNKWIIIIDNEKRSKNYIFDIRLIDRSRHISYISSNCSNRETQYVDRRM